MTVPEHYLALWRTTDPAELFADQELRAGLLAFLAARLDPRDDSEKRLLDRLLRNRYGQADAAFKLAGSVARFARSGGAPDFAMSWALLSALHGHDGATVALVQALMQRVRNLALGSGDDAAPETVPQEAARAEHLALAWARRIDRCLLKDFSSWIRDLESLTRDEDADETDAAPETAAATRDETPTLQVLGTGTADTGWENDRAYAALRAPLPLKGGSIRPELLRAALHLEFPNMVDAIDSIVQDLELRRRAGVSWARFRPLLLVGPPGTGKTRLARRVGEILGTGHGEIGVGGMSDNRLIEGTARGWAHAQPCWPLLVMSRTGTANPVLLVDEIDKARASDNGDVMATLLGMLERETAGCWFDACLLVSADLSQISWILTANSTTPLPRPLISRLRIVHVGHPGRESFDRILENLLRDVASELSIRRDDLPALTDEAVALLRDGFARGAGIRELKRGIEAALAQAEMAPRRLH